MNAIASDRPDVATAIRGYDRPQVDDYIDRMLHLVAEAEDRARAAESELEFSRHSTVGPRVTEIFELAIAEAKEIQGKTSTDCERARTDARAEAERLVSKAEEEASAIKERVEREREEVLSKLEPERRRAEREVDRLEETKSTMLAELRRLQEALAAAAGLGGDSAQEEASEADTSEAATAEAEVPSRRQVPSKQRNAA